MIVDGKPKDSLRHAWNVGPDGEIVDTTNRPAVLGGREVAFTYLPNDEKHEHERRLVEALVGPPADYIDDPREQEDLGLLADLLEGLDEPGEPED